MVQNIGQNIYNDPKKKMPRPRQLINESQTKDRRLRKRLNGPIMTIGNYHHQEAFIDEVLHYAQCCCPKAQHATYLPQSAQVAPTRDWHPKTHLYAAHHLIVER